MKLAHKERRGPKCRQDTPKESLHGRSFPVPSEHRNTNQNGEKAAKGRLADDESRLRNFLLLKLFEEHVCDCRGVYPRLFFLLSGEPLALP